MKFLKNLFLLVLAPLLLAEVVLRLFLFVRPVTPMTQTDSNIQKKAMNQFVQKKIDLLWNRELKDTKTFYEPPFQVFVNRGFGDSKRMADIAVRSALPKNTVSTQQNFLRLNASPDIGNFTVTSNSLGFRSAEHGEKQANDFRIITLGSYPAFGHGVNDFETYSYYLEEDLNRTSSGQHFEVWNGGRQGGTSIMGLARLQYEVGKYQPDLIIWDYGWIEMYLRADIVSSEEEMAGLRLVPMSSFTRFFYRNCNTFDFLALCRQLQKKYRKVNVTDAMDGWEQSMREMKYWAHEHHVPVIFLRHTGVAIAGEAYQKFDSPSDKFYFVNTGESLKAPLTAAERSEFWSKDNWLSELNYSSKDTEGQDELLYHVDAIQYNQIAYRRFAAQLKDFIIYHKAELQIK